MFCKVIKTVLTKNNNRLFYYGFTHNIFLICLINCFFNKKLKTVKHVYHCFSCWFNSALLFPYGTVYIVYNHSNNNNMLYLYVLGATMYAVGLWTIACGDFFTLLKTAPRDR